MPLCYYKINLPAKLRIILETTKIQQPFSNSEICGLSDTIGILNNYIGSEAKVGIGIKIGWAEKQVSKLGA